MKTLLISALAGVVLLTGCDRGSATDIPDANTQPTASWLSTAANSSTDDLLEQRPAMVYLWAGSGFERQYTAPRGHQFAVADVVNTLRSADGSKSASCFSCKSPGAPMLMAEYGENGFGSKTMAEVGHEMAVSVGCDDCHQADQQSLRLARPFALEAMAKVQQPFAKQNHATQAAQTCGQCHVTYYFQPEQGNRVNIPWIFGNSADQIEKYYDTRRFYDWIHPISGTPMVKARHPDYEQWSRSSHAKLGVTCVTCHMPVKTDANGREYHDHNTANVWDNFDSQCIDCHVSESTLKAKMAKQRQRIDDARSEVEALLVKAHAETGALWRAKVSQAQLTPIQMLIRHAQWRWDFAVSSHGVHAHNPQEGLALLAAAKTQALQARALIAPLLAAQPDLRVRYPDLSSKAAAQQFIGLDMPALEQQKQQFLREQVQDRWPGW
ncbi:ammonia-forming cytochrome c nitrite reductase subunit c552 [Ferrimonas senticii]|uniref:ammonia-forming cytochrome c nitrite reductase subunit c552 n=1 Tax=Ferrimonas senticii TaxID=394566 RepID=UPI00041A1711|nr:ammonia-forming cytochrome c nitrite reductase subunit c552 [Ferrimonas senticii]